MERRSVRQRKSVNYSPTYSDEDSEDDFASPPPAKKAKASPPPAKKAKEKTKDVTQTRPESKLTHTATGTVDLSTAARGRPSRDEKQFNRNLQRVLEASQLSSKEPGPKDDDDFCPDGGDSSSGCSSVSGSDSDFDASPQLQPKKGRGKAAEGKKVAQSKAKSSKKTESHVAGATKLAGKSTGRAKKTQNAPTPSVRLPATPVPMSPVSVNLEATGSPTLPGSRPTPGLGVRRMPKWTPPARATPGCEATRKAPTGTGSGGAGPAIRVGLSRTARVKPLHTRPTIPNT